MRIRLYKEREATVDGRLIVYSSFDDGPIPVLAYPKGEKYPSAELIGKVTDVCRVLVSGWVTGELHLEDGHGIDGRTAAASFHQCDVDPPVNEGDPMVLKNAKLCDIVLVETGACWPGMEIEGLDEFDG